MTNRMKLKSAIFTVKVLGVATFVLAILLIITKSVAVGFAMLAMLIAMIAVMFLFFKCPHCGQHFYKVNDSWITSNRCPICGKELDP